MRKTKIICTIGPASESEERLRELMLAGMNVARFNFSHGSHEEHKAKFDRVIKVSSELKLPVATLLDTKGPEIRLKDIEGGKTAIKIKFIIVCVLFCYFLCFKIKAHRRNHRSTSRTLHFYREAQFVFKFVSE